MNKIEQNRPTSDMTNLADAICIKSCIALSIPPVPAFIDCENWCKAATNPKNVNNRPAETNVFGKMRKTPGPNPKSSTFRNDAGRIELRSLKGALYIIMYDGFIKLIESFPNGLSWTFWR